MSNLHDLYELCGLITSKGINHANVRAAVQRLDRMDKSRRAEATFARQHRSQTCNQYTAGVVTRYMTKLSGHYQSMLSAPTNRANSTDPYCPDVDGFQVWQHLQHNLAVTYEADAECWHEIAGQQESDKLAVATAASKAGVFQMLAMTAHDVAARLSAVLSLPPHLRTNRPSPSATWPIDINMAVSIIRLWQRFVNSWPTSGRVLAGKHVALLAQPVARLVKLLLQDANEVVQHFLIDSGITVELQHELRDEMVDGYNLISVFKAAVDGCLDLTRAISKEIRTASAPAGPAQQGGVTLQDLLDTSAAEVPAVFALGTACHLLAWQKLLKCDEDSPSHSSPQLLQESSSKAAGSGYPESKACTPLSKLLSLLQLDALNPAFSVYLNSAWQPQPIMPGRNPTVISIVKELMQALHWHHPFFDLEAPRETTWQDQTTLHQSVDSILHGVPQICSLISKPEGVLQKQQQAVKWLEAMTSLVRLLKDAVLCTVHIDSQAGGTASSSSSTSFCSRTGSASVAAETSLLAVAAILSVTETQLSFTTAEAVPTACTIPYHLNSKEIICSIFGLEKCFRSLVSSVAAGPCVKKLLQQALDAVCIIAAHQQRLQDASAAVSISCRSLHLTCPKLAQNYSSIQPNIAAVLAQNILQTSTKGNNYTTSQVYGLCDAAQLVTGGWTDSTAGTAGTFIKVLAGRCMFTIGSTLQQAAGRCETGADQDSSSGLATADISWCDQVSHCVNQWAGSTHTAAWEHTLRSRFAARVHRQLEETPVVRVKEHSLGAFAAKLRNLRALTRIGRDTEHKAGYFKSLGLYFADCGAALCTEYPVPYCCNNPSCVNLACDSELLLVSGKGCVCGGCQVARYCSRECQKKHWKQHKPVCLKLRGAAADG